MGTSSTHDFTKGGAELKDPLAPAYMPTTRHLENSVGTVEKLKVKAEILMPNNA